MMRRIIAAAMSAVLAIGLLPCAAFAANDLQAGAPAKTVTATSSESKTALGLFMHIRDNSAPGSAERADAEKAIGILTGKILGDGGSSTSKSAFKSVKLSNSGDAASLKNFDASLDFIDKYNSYRAKENKAEGTKLSTKVGLNCRMMAISIVQCDWSKSQIAHSMAFNVGENLSWGYSNPFDGWYTEEKADYKAKNGKQTGHYLNIVDKSTGVTGFAVNTNGAAYGICHEQSFDWSGSEVVYTTSQFRSKWFDAYYHSQGGKAKNPMTVKAKKKAVTLKAGKKTTNITVKNAKGKVTFKNVSKNATAKKKFKVDSKGGVKVVKGTKKGAYKVIIEVKAKGTSRYKNASAKVSFTVRVK